MWGEPAEKRQPLPKLVWMVIDCALALRGFFAGAASIDRNRPGLLQKPFHYISKNGGFVNSIFARWNIRRQVEVVSIHRLERLLKQCHCNFYFCVLFTMVVCNPSVIGELTGRLNLESFKISANFSEGSISSTRE